MILVLDLKLNKKISYKLLAQETSVSKTSAQKALLDNRLLFVVNLKDTVYNTNPHTLDELRNNTCHKISSISREELQTVNNNAFHGYTEGKSFNICSSGVFITVSKGYYHCDHCVASFTDC
jgi:hypothetical protein